MFIVAQGKGPFFYKRIHLVRRERTGYDNKTLIHTWCGQHLLEPHQVETIEEARAIILFDRRAPAECGRCKEAERLAGIHA